MEQLPLDLQFTVEPSNEATEMTHDEIVNAYYAAVGVNPTYRGLTDEEMLSALKNPEAERERLIELDRESNQEDIFSTYKR